ncbi:MAG: dolichyl-phosphate beta-glucosyltransferase [Armatimonadia bacterium]
MDAKVPVRSLSIVIPAYNEKKRLPPSLERICDWAADQSRAIDIVLVDDGSTDGTLEAAEATVAGRVPLQALVNKPNRGKGFSVRRGMMEAEGDCVLFTDADLSTPIEEADRLLEAIEAGSEVAIGSRGMKESQIKLHQPWWREKAGKLFGLVTRTIALPGIRDSQCGFKCFRREAAQAIFSRQTLDGWAFDVELLVIARQLGYEIAQVPVEWVNDPNTKVHMLTDGPKMVLDMIRVRLKHRHLTPADRRDQGR